MLKKVKLQSWVIMITLFFSLYSSLIFSSQALYPGEQVVVINHIETLIKFSIGDSHKPLIIFVPGDSHLARISYGYPNGKPQDFLNYWLNKKGYSFLGLSYPTDNPVFSKTYPAFSIKDWGNQIADVAQKIIQANNLSPHIIILGWSMGGSIEEAVNVAAKKHHLTVDAFIGLSAVPPLPYLMQPGPFDTGKMLPNKLANRKPLFAWFIKSLQEQNRYNQHEIIPLSIYLHQFLGNIPTSISAEGYHYQNGKFIYNIERTIQDSGVYNFAETPFIGLIQDVSPSAPKITLIDPASWNFIRAEMIYKTYLTNKQLTKLSKQNWNKLKTIINNLPHNLTLTIEGNHFFFVGEKGAKATAEKIVILISRINQTKNQLTQLTSQLK